MSIANNNKLHGNIRIQAYIATISNILHTYIYSDKLQNAFMLLCKITC
jgi:hypothetical protein